MTSTNTITVDGKKYLPQDIRKLVKESRGFNTVLEVLKDANILSADKINEISKAIKED